WTGKKRLNSYSKHGTVFGARMAQDIARAKIRNPEVSQSVNSFVDRCIITRGLIGYPFTLQEVRNSNNVWKLVRDRTRGVVTKWKKYEKGGVTIHNCTEGVRWMEGLMATEIKDIVGMFMKKHHQDKSNQTKFLKNIATVYEKGSATDAVNIIQHQLLIQAIDDTLASYDGIDYGLIRAKMQHESGAWISLAFAGEWLPAMLGVFKIVTYACFILILPLFIVSGGIGIYLGWMRVIFSFSLWPSLYTILNMVVDYSYDTSKIITYGALSTSRNQYDIIGVVAAGLGMAIPFLASWIVRMGEGGLVHLATPIMQSMSGGVASAGAEMASGNVSLNNRNIGNESYNNISSDKLNTNFEQFSGSNTFNHDSGMVETRTAGGDQILRTGE
ncbi:MAG: conjugal transfer protein TraG, partial [Gammaproteobacteria bacterium]|nr:conjugal transfer protein TraG [Gammaproteobacteria bacterium]